MKMPARGASLAVAATLGALLLVGGLPVGPGLAATTNSPPVASDHADETRESSRLWVTLPARDPDGDALTFDIVRGPEHGSLEDCAADACVYRPTPGFVGDDAFTWRANDGQADSNVATYAVNVFANTPPVAYDRSDRTARDTPLFVYLSAFDDDVDDLTFTIVQAPVRGSLGPCSAGHCTYTPQAGYVGPDSLTWRANDGLADSNVARLDIEIGAVANRPPVAHDQTRRTRRDLPLDLYLDASDPDRQTLSFTIVEAPRDGSLSGCARGECRYTPSAGFTGSDRFRWRASDGESTSSTATFSLSVVANARPVARPDAYAVAEASRTPLAVLANDSDADLDFLSIDAFQHPSARGGSVDCSDGATCTYEPRAGFSGRDTFTYRVEDGHGGRESTTVTVDVEACPDLRSALGDGGVVSGQAWLACSSSTAHAARGAGLSPLFAPVGDRLALLTSGRAALADGPDKGPDTGVDNGTRLRGARDVSILRLDLSLPSASDCLSLDFVLASEEYPEFAGSGYDDAFVAELDGSDWSLGGGGMNAPRDFAIDAEGRSMSVASPWLSPPAVETATGMEYDGATVRLQARTPVTPGAHQLFLSILDAGDGLLDSAVLVDGLLAHALGSGGCVRGVSRPPSAADDAAATDEDLAVTIDVLANDSAPGGEDLSVAAVGLPSHGSTRVESNGTITYEPDADRHGADAFDYTLLSASGGLQRARVRVEVASVNDPPTVAAGEDGSGAEGAALALAGLVFDPDHAPTITWSASPGPDVDAGATCAFQPSGAASVDVSCSDDGTWALTLTADDGEAPAVSDGLTLAVANAAPVVAAGADRAAFIGDAVALAPASFSDPGGNDEHEATIDWGDGTIDAGVVVRTGAGGTVDGEHAYAAVGSYTVTVTVHDDDGGSHADALLVTVTERPVVTPAPRTRVVDDRDAGFTRTGTGWKRVLSGLRGRSFWSPVRKGTPVRRAEWRAALDAPGLYEVQVHIPPEAATTRRAAYRIVARDRVVTRELDQSAARPGWASLGRFRLPGTGIVRLTDRTGERTASGRRIAFDAVRFVPAMTAAAAAEREPAAAERDPAGADPTHTPDLTPREEQDREPDPTPRPDPTREPARARDPEPERSASPEARAAPEGSPDPAS